MPPFISRTIALAFVIISLSTSVYAWGLEKPTVAYIDYQVGTPSSEKVPVTLNFISHNPNPIGLKDVLVSSEFFFEGKRFLKAKDSTITLAANQKRPIKVFAEVIYKNIMYAASSITKRAIKGDKSIPILVKVHIHGTPTVYMKFGGIKFSFSQKFEQTVNIPIPQDMLQNPSQALDTFKGLF